MTARRADCAQVWIELRSSDPEAISALAVARDSLEVGAAVAGLRRLRLIELQGKLPGREEIESLLHRSIQFYNPLKEKCHVRRTAKEPPPIDRGEQVALVTERDADRREAAERWWKHETGERVEVREAVAWVMRAAPEADAESCVMELSELRNRRHGLLCNPHCQDLAISSSPPLPWIHAPVSARKRAAP